MYIQTAPQKTMYVKQTVYGMSWFSIQYNIIQIVYMYQDSLLSTTTSLLKNLISVIIAAIKMPNKQHKQLIKLILTYMSVIF